MEKIAGIFFYAYLALFAVLMLMIAVSLVYLFKDTKEDKVFRKLMEAKTWVLAGFPILGVIEAVIFFGYGAIGRGLLWLLVTGLQYLNFKSARKDLKKLVEETDKLQDTKKLLVTLDERYEQHKLFHKETDPYEILKKSREAGHHKEV